MAEVKMIADGKYIEGFAAGYTSCEENLYKSYGVSGMEELVKNIRKEMLEEMKLFTETHFCSFTADRKMLFDNNGIWSDVYKEFGI